ncbi:unnamed protein product [Tuber aestivum]|uniref:Uncharacterized protein n=1 Tax=Tuber aestivum TaxID=59557 RepID=A0A292Q186_9PEZI|nr:unnamed protein product [Tuber aestivum]
MIRCCELANQKYMRRTRKGEAKDRGGLRYGNREGEARHRGRRRHSRITQRAWSRIPEEKRQVTRHRKDFGVQMATVCWQLALCSRTCIVLYCTVSGPIPVIYRTRARVQHRPFTMHERAVRFDHNCRIKLSKCRSRTKLDWRRRVEPSAPSSWSWGTGGGEQRNSAIYRTESALLAGRLKSTDSSAPERWSPLCARMVRVQYSTLLSAPSRQVAECSRRTPEIHVPRIAGVNLPVPGGTVLHRTVRYEYEYCTIAQNYDLSRTERRAIRLTAWVGGFYRDDDWEMDKWERPRSTIAINSPFFLSFFPSFSSLFLTRPLRQVLSTSEIGTSLKWAHRSRVYHTLEIGVYCTVLEHSPLCFFVFFVQNDIIFLSFTAQTNRDPAIYIRVQHVSCTIRYRAPHCPGFYACFRIGWRFKTCTVAHAHVENIFGVEHFHPILTPKPDHGCFGKLGSVDFRALPSWTAEVVFSCKGVRPSFRNVVVAPLFPCSPGDVPYERSARGTTRRAR